MANAAQIRRIAKYLEGADGAVVSGGRGAGAGYEIGTRPADPELAAAATVTNGRPVWSNGNGWASAVVEERPFPYEGGAVRAGPRLQGVARGPVEPHSAKSNLDLEMGMAATLALVGTCLIWFWENKVELAIWIAAVAMIFAPGADAFLK